MSFNADGEVRQEIVIVRRGGQDAEEAHHGGVWKIAFADFMTAMMCFFLVMWLINAANEQTRAALASYFNPVKLIDRNTSRKGLDAASKSPGDPNMASKRNTKETDDPGSAGEAEAGPAKEQNSTDLAKTRKHSDKNLFADPYSVLSEIAGETGVLQNTSAKGDGGSQDAGPATGASGGQSYRDPFAPDFWARQVEVPQDAKTPGKSGPGQRLAEKSAPVQTSDKAEGTAGEMVAAAEAATQAGLGATAGARDAAAARTGDEAKGSAKSGEQVAGTQSPGDLASGAQRPGDRQAGKLEPGAAKAEAREAEEAAEAEAKTAIDKEAEAIRKQLAGAFNSDEALYHGLTVTETGRGVLISVSDQANFAMFEIGSAVPKRETVLAMEKIAKILAGHKGDILIDGHTDGRPFRTDTYDNWRLSSARAQSAYYMLVRAGVDEKRVLEVAGFADRKLKVKDDPYAAANRRIEILLEPK